eukprot:TRINITY_DN13590_c0_g1_i1.p1 TRINITY_DN13590_c0_g1~~TRINITY_DN13590_c0_g1_i1.p1  ORF type:complete len:518 (-),score=123.59 TRINITY_DN13590_c0_g1_i1:21-1574(-)
MSAPKKIIFVKKTAPRPTEGEGEKDKDKEKSAFEGLPRLTQPKYILEYSDHDFQRKQALDPEKKGEYSQFNPYFAKVQNAQYISSNSSSKRVIEITVDIAGSDMHYVPGDYVEILCSNPPSLVDAIISKLNLNPDLFINIQQNKSDQLKAAEGPSQPPQHPVEATPPHLNVKTVRDLFLHALDITQPPSKKFLRVMAEYCTNEEEKKRLLTLCSVGGRQEYHNLVETHSTFFDLLTLFPTCNIPLHYIIELLPPLTPRKYSISSSPLLTPNSATFVFSVIDYISENQKHIKGLCSTWLENIVGSFLLQSTSSHISQLSIDNERNSSEEKQPIASSSSSSEDIFIPLYIKGTPQFHLPFDTSIPIIMVGPGTGVAPFLGFIDHRRALQNNGAVLGESWLFFGCRHSSSDYLPIRKKLESYLPQQDSSDTTPLTHFITSFSRDQDDVVYVQHKLEEYADDILRIMVEKNGIFYLCGDVKGMVKNVRETLLKILEAKKIQGELQINEWVKEKRFISEAWF